MRPRGLDVAATPVFVESVETMKDLAVPSADQPRLRSLAQWILNKGISWRHDVRREHLLYSERELEAIVRIRAMREGKMAREREKKRQREAIKADKVAAKAERRTLKEQRQR